MIVSQGQQFTEDLVRQYQNIFDAAFDGVIICDLETGAVMEANPAACHMHGYQRDEFIGKRLTDFVHTYSQNEFCEFIRTNKSDGLFEIRPLHLRSDGSVFFAEWCGTFLTFQGRSCLLAIMRNVSKRILAEQLLHKRIETRTYEQAKLLQISYNLASTLEFQPDLILDQLREIIEYSHGVIFTLEDSTLVNLAIRGLPRLERTLPLSIHLENPGILKELFNSLRPICIADIWEVNSETRFLRSCFNQEGALLLEGMRSWMWVPLAVQGRILGGIGIADSRKNYYVPHHADLALSVANQAAITMINAELYRRAQALAILEERQRLARNLHDSVNQTLFSAGLIAEVLPRLWERDQAEARQSIEDLRRLTRGAQAEMSALLAELRPSTLTDSNLGDLLRLLGNALSGRINIPVIVSVTDEIVLPADIQIVFYRICQEALNNIAKHAKANKVEIDLKRLGTEVKMCIRDDGQGFDPKHNFTGHYGLSIMRERAESVGANMSINSKSGFGTEINISWTKPSPPIQEVV